MIKSIDELDKRPFIDLTGPDGNAFVVVARARQYARELGIDENKIISAMMGSTYENLIAIFEKHFGEYVDIYR